MNEFLKKKLEAHCPSWHKVVEATLGVRRHGHVPVSMWNYGHSFPPDPSPWNSEEKVGDDENEMLTRPFSMEKNKVAGSDKISIEFYQTCWDIIKTDIIELFSDFHKGDWMSVGSIMG